MSLLGRLLGIRGHGWRPDAADPRDRKLRQLGLSASVPSSASVLNGEYLIKDQASTSSCVTQALTNAVRLAYEVGNGVACPDLSALFAYYNARREDGRGFADDGTTIRSGIKCLQHFGACPETDWAFKVSRVNKMPTWAAYRTAHDLRGIRGYYRIDDGDLTSVKMALAAHRPVVAGWDVNERFRQYDGSYTIGAMVGPFIGGHAMLIGGYEDTGSSAGTKWKIPNSWGVDFGDHGCVFANDSFMRQARDLWAIDV